MARQISWDRENDELVLTFPFELALKDWVKTLPGARFHGVTRTWRIPARHAAQVVPALRQKQFAASGPLPDTDDAADAPPEPAEPVGLTVAQLREQASEAIRMRFGGPVWLVAVVSGYRPSGTHRWQYIELMDPDDGGGQGGRMAMTAVLYAEALARVEDALQRADLQWGEGLRVRLRGRVQVGRRLEIQFAVDDIDTRWSLGELSLRRDEILRTLAAEGLTDRNAGVALPMVPLRVALVTSAGSDAFEDVRKTLADSGYPFVVSVFDVRVQGDELERSVLRALDLIARHAERFDVCLLVRGGGARSELAAWDNLAVGRAVALLPVRVVTGIGHERDRSVPDALAIACKTPTHAATYLVDQVVAAHARLEDGAARLQRAGLEAVRRQWDVLLRPARALDVHARRTVALQRVRLLDVVPGRLVLAVRNRLAREQSDLTRATAGLQRGRQRTQQESVQVDRLSTLLRRMALQRHPSAQQTLDRLTARLDLAATARLREAQRELHHLHALARSADPQRVLERGFALVRTREGAPVVRAGAVPAEATLQIQFIDGSVVVQTASPSPSSSRSTG